MVTYLLKTKGSEGFLQIIDFLNTSHIKYALMKNPTIYTSLIQQLSQTAAANTLDTREVQITATIDGKVKLVSKAFIRRHLKLEDSDGISTLPNTKSLSNLLLWGPILQGEGSIVLVESHHTPSGSPTTSQPPLSSPSRIPTRQETEVPQPSSPPHTHIADEVASTGVDVKHRGAATTVSSLDVGQGSGNIDKTPSMPHDSPFPRVNILGSDEGNMSLNELTVSCTKLSLKVESLEADLKQTKNVYGAAYTKLIMKEIKIESKDISTTEKLVYNRRSASKDKGKGSMIESEHEQTTTKLQQGQERAGYEAAIRFHEQFDEEERKRIARVHEEASSFNVEE
nr:hypothetical protein [Tanacetum cinerariifolium]